MQYIDVAWIHDFPDAPIRLVSELDELRLEIRKLEFYRSGIVGFASAEGATADTQLGVVPVPLLNEINEDQQFKGTAMDEVAFDDLWRTHVAGREA